MKTKPQILHWILLLIALSLTSIGWAQNTNPTQSVCPGNQNYWVIPGNIANSFSWAITPGVSGTDWTITPNGNDYTIIVNWANVVVPVNYTLSITETTPPPNSCSTTKTVLVTVNARPSAPTAIVSPQPSCTVPTGTITVTAPTGSGMTYSIDGINYTNTTGIFTLVPTGSYTVTAKSAQGCVSLGTSVTVNTQPLTPAAPTASIVQPTCIVATATLTVTNPPVGAGITFSVTGTNPVVAVVTNTTGIFPGLTPGLYDVTTTNAAGCVSPPLSVSIVAAPATPPAPTVVITQPSCFVATGIITVTAPAPGTGISFTVTGTNPVVAPVTNSTGIFSGLNPGVYNVTTTNASGCVSTATISTINSQPLTPTTSPIWHN